jgi:hypothetical protein
MVDDYWADKAKTVSQLPVDVRANMWPTLAGPGGSVAWNGDRAILVTRAPELARLYSSGNPNDVAKFEDLVRQAGAAHLTRQYSQTMPALSGIRRMMFPRWTNYYKPMKPEITIPDKYCDSGGKFTYCSGPAADVLNQVGISTGRGVGNELPADLAAHPAYETVGVHVPEGSAQKGKTDAETKANLLELMDGAQRQRVVAGLVTAALMGLAGYGGARGISSLTHRWQDAKARREERVKARRRERRQRREPDMQKQSFVGLMGLLGWKGYKAYKKRKAKRLTKQSYELAWPELEKLAAPAIANAVVQPPEKRRKRPNKPQPPKSRISPHMWGLLGGGLLASLPLLALYQDTQQVYPVLRERLKSAPLLNEAAINQLHSGDTVTYLTPAKDPPE